MIKYRLKQFPLSDTNTVVKWMNANLHKDGTVIIEFTRRPNSISILYSQPVDKHELEQLERESLDASALDASALEVQD